MSSPISSSAGDIAVAERAGHAASQLEMFRDPLRIPPLLRGQRADGISRLTIPMRDTSVRLHSQLPPTRVWTYNGSFPGPTIEVRRGEPLHVAWLNRILGEYPLTAVEVPAGVAQPVPGRDGVAPLPKVAALPPWTVVHLHGSRTNAVSDGWMDNGVLSGEGQLSEYLNDQHATALWYHDHAAAITAYNVMTGLAGMYLIRDDEEDALHLPSGDQEIPLLLCDRNLDTDQQGRLTGRLLHKVVSLPDLPGVLVPFTGPFMLVNGVIWPHLEVERRWYRFRVLNAGSFRTYRLELRDEMGQPLSGMIRQIGTDAGLLPEPLTLDELVLAPAERADILIDFSGFAGRRLTLGNTQVEPFSPTQPAPNPDIMQFRVGRRPVMDGFTLPRRVSSSFVRLSHDSVPAHRHRWVVLTPPAVGPEEIWEMVEVDGTGTMTPADGIIQVIHRGRTVTLRRVARNPADAIHFVAERDGWEQWNILNLGGPSHPFHIHLIRFQATRRDHYDTSGFDPLAGGTTRPLTLHSPGTLDPNEQGWKDVIRVAPGDLVSVLGQFTGGSGRFMYHCHILEHEDHGMMRSFLVAPSQVLALGGGHHAGPHALPSTATGADPAAADGGTAAADDGAAGADGGSATADGGAAGTAGGPATADGAGHGGWHGRFGGEEDFPGLIR